MKRKQHVQSFLSVWHKRLLSATLDMHDIRKTSVRVICSEFFLKTISLKGAMSHYFRVFRENLSLITSLKLENAYVVFPYR